MDRAFSITTLLYYYFENYIIPPNNRNLLRTEEKWLDESQVRSDVGVAMPLLVWRTKIRQEVE